MMAKVNFEETFEIFLFTEQFEENNFSKLSEFLSFLKFNKVNLPYKFSYVSRGDGLIPELTLNENILMDFSPNSLTASKELQFQEFLKEENHAHLEKLYQMIIMPHELPTSADAQMKKLCTLIKSLIFEGQFIFLEEPEKDLGPECLEVFINALKAHSIRNKQNVFIFSHDLNLWMPHAHKHVKREADFSFTTEEVSRDWQWKKEREQFFEPKKAAEIKRSQLQFHIPEKSPGKRSTKKSAA